MNKRFDKNIEKEKRTNEELVAIALKDIDSDEAWELIGILHYRGSKNEFNIAKNLSKSEKSLERELGTAILGQLGWQDRTFLSESVEILINCLNDSDENVVSSAAIALGHRKDKKAVKHLSPLKNHQSEDIRFGVVQGLSGLDVEEAVDVLIELTKDEDYDVKNWATFGVASMNDLDDEKIRDALYELCFDNDFEIRGEALIGLAKRKDKRCIKLITEELNGEFNGDYALEAAEITGSELLLATLLDLRIRIVGKVEKHFIKSLDIAVKACSNVEI